MPQTTRTWGEVKVKECGVNAHFKGGERADQVQFEELLAMAGQEMLVEGMANLASEIERPPQDVLWESITRRAVGQTNEEIQEMFVNVNHVGLSEQLSPVHAQFLRRTDC